MEHINLFSKRGIKMANGEPAQGIFIIGIIDSKRIQETKDRPTQFKLMINVPGQQNKPEVSVNSADYERLQIGDPFKCSVRPYSKTGIFWTVL